MKITNQQINAIVSEAIRKENLRVSNENNKLREDTRIVAEARKYLSLIEKIPLDIRKSIYGSYGINLDNIVNAIIAAKKLTIPYELNYSEIRNKIIIASIDSKDIEELKSKLKIEI